MPSGKYLHKLGKENHSFGKHLSDKTKEKLRMFNLGKKHSEETKKKISQSMKGKKHTEVMKKKMSAVMKGNKNRLGYSNSQNHRKKISLAVSGEKHWNWQDGKSKEKYTIDWNNTLRTSIRERDRYVCKVCGEKQGDRAFNVHHIDYNKKNCDPKNLITLCISCHIKTNSNRNYWKNYFQKYV